MVLKFSFLRKLHLKDDCYYKPAASYKGNNLMSGSYLLVRIINAR